MQELTLEEMLQRIHVLTMDSKVSRKLIADVRGLEIIAQIVLQHQNLDVSYDIDKEKFIISDPPSPS